MLSETPLEPEQGPPKVPAQAHKRRGKGCVGGWGNAEGHMSLRILFVTRSFEKEEQHTGAELWPLEQIDHICRIHTKPRAVSVAVYGPQSRKYLE